MQEQKQKIVPNIYQRINLVMSEVESVQKESKKVNGQYTFVSHDGVAKALHMPMVRAGIVMVPSVSKMTQDSNRTTVDMEISFINIDDPIDRLVVNYPGYGIDNQDKGIGKAVSYAVKYALLKVFCLETGDDVEKDNISYEKKKIANVSTLSNEQVEIIMTEVGGEEDRLIKLMDFFSVTKLQEIPAECFDKIMQTIQKRKNTDKVTPIRKEAVI